MNWLKWKPGTVYLKKHETFQQASLSDKEIKEKGGTKVSSLKELGRVLWSALIILSMKDFR